jgi:hypothetical protein
MREIDPMSLEEFDNLIGKQNFENMSDEQLNTYSEIFMEKIREQFERDEDYIHFWCPKCECRDAYIEIEEDNGRAMATCPQCRMAVVALSLGID